MFQELLFTELYHLNYGLDSGKRITTLRVKSLGIRQLNIQGVWVFEASLGGQHSLFVCP